MSTHGKPPSRKPVATEKGDSIAIYHVMYAHENFDDTADILFQLVKNAARTKPGKKRILFFDIDGHRNELGGFDHDAEEIQTYFVLTMLSRWLTEFSMPLGHYKTNEQHEDLPEHVVITPGGPRAERDDMLKTQATASGMRIFDAETAEWILPDGTRQKNN